MSQTSAHAIALFGRYLKCWNARDIEGVAACYTHSSMFILPTGEVVLPDRAALVLLLESVFAGLEKAEFSHTEVGQISTRPCGDGLAIVDAANLRRLKKDGSLLEEIDGHYVMRKTEEGWRFAVAVVCSAGWQQPQ